MAWESVMRALCQWSVPYSGFSCAHLWTEASFFQSPSCSRCCSLCPQEHSTSEMTQTFFSFFTTLKNLNWYRFRNPLLKISVPAASVTTLNRYHTQYFPPAALGSVWCKHLTDTTAYMSLVSNSFKCLALLQGLDWRKLLIHWDWPL